MTPKYTTVNRIFSKVIRDFGKSISESDMIEWTGEALEAINAPQLYQEAVAFIEVKNFTCELPNFLFNVIQIAKDTQWDGSNGLKLCPSDIIAAKKCQEQEDIDYGCKGIDCGCESGYFEDYLYEDSCGNLISDCNALYIDEIFESYWLYPQWTQSALYCQRFVPIRLTTNTMFSAIACKDSNMPKTWFDEYSFATENTLKFSFEKGMVAVSYLKYRTDEETGYPLIPDHEIYATAITSYIIYKFSCREFYAGRDGSQAKMQKAEMDWQWYCKRASNQAMMPSVDTLQNLLDQRTYLVPRNNRYYGFFGKLNHPENKAALY